MLTLDEIRTAVVKVGQKYQLKNAYLFGSYARGEATEGSDVDIIIDDGGNVHSLLELSGLRLDIVKELDGVEVDVLTMDGVLPRFYDMIKDERVLLYGA